MGIDCGCIWSVPDWQSGITSERCAVKLFTTGCGLTAPLARKMRSAGLFSACVSLNHWDRMTHDRGRGYPGAFRIALQAIRIFKESLFMGTLNGGHPGGMVPLKREDARSLHPAVLPENVYVADASLFPASAGGPPSFTIMALSKRIAKTIARI